VVFESWLASNGAIALPLLLVVEIGL